MWITFNITKYNIVKQSKSEIRLMAVSGIKQQDFAMKNNESLNL